MGCARCQPWIIGDRVGPYLVPDGIDPRLLHVLHVAFKVALRAHQLHLYLFMVQMHLVLHAMRGGPQAQRLEESVAEHLREHVIVVALGACSADVQVSLEPEECLAACATAAAGCSRPHPPPVSCPSAAARRHQQRAQVGSNVVALYLLEGSKNLSVQGNPPIE